MPFSVPDHPEVARLKTAKFEREEKAVFIDQFDMKTLSYRAYKAELRLYNDKKEPGVYHYTVKARFGKRKKQAGMSGIICKTLYNPTQYLDIIKFDGRMSEGAITTPVSFWYNPGTAFLEFEGVQYRASDSTGCYSDMRKNCRGGAVIDPDLDLFPRYGVDFE